MRIMRVFPRRTKATPTDELAHIGPPDLFTEDKAPDRIHVSVTFSWGLPAAEKLLKAWSSIAPTEIGGPATGQRGEGFTPGVYLKKGYVTTSRGCPNRCWFCSVWRREGETIRELPVTEGWNVLDDNLLACSEEHIREVFDMLSKQKQRPEFTGGLEPARLRQWHIDEMLRVKTKQAFFAYDGPEDREPLFEAGKLLKASCVTIRSRIPRAYCLIGFPKDTFDSATKRLEECLDFGFLPMAMLYRDNSGARNPAWARFQRSWARPAAIYRKYLEARRD